MLKAITIALTLIATSVTAGTVVKEGNTLTLTGSVDSWMYNKFLENFDDDTKYIRLDSPGGYVKHGNNIIKIIEANKDRLITEAIGGCESMCAVIWLAADKHIFNADAEIGFHLSYISSRTYWDDLQWESGFNGMQGEIKKNGLQDVSAYFKHIDNKASFGEFLAGMEEFGVMPTDMWYPTQEELMKFEPNWTPATEEWIIND